MYPFQMDEEAGCWNWRKAWKIVRSRRENCFWVKLSVKFQCFQRKELQESSKIWKPRPRTLKNACRYFIEIKMIKSGRKEERMHKFASSWYTLPKVTNPGFSANKRCFCAVYLKGSTSIFLIFLLKSLTNSLDRTGFIVK